MSKYTTEVRFICESNAGLFESQGYSNVNEILNKACPKVFDFDFPIFDENYRLPLEKKILSHFYTREICCETVGLWKLWLNNKMNEIMPYYNQLYKSALLEFNPFYDVDITRDHVLNGKAESFNESNTTGTSNETIRDAYSDTPQGALDNVENNTYLTNARKTTSEGGTTGKGTTEGNVENTEQYLEHVKGTNGGQNFSKRLEDYRKTFLNIDMSIIKDLEVLFFSLW